MRTRLRLFIICVVAIGILTACGSNDQDFEVNHSSNLVEERSQSDNREETAFPITLTDGQDNEVTIEDKPERIASLIPSNTEILFALGLNEEIVGVSDFDNYPEEALEKEKIGSMEFNVEKIISLEPDIVFAHGSSAHNSESGLDQLRDAGIRVVVVNDASTFADVYQSIEMIATATGTDKKGQEIIEEMKDRIVEIEERVSAIEPDDEVTVWVEVQPAPDLYTTGKGTFMDEMLSIIKAKNVAGDEEGWVSYTEEDAVKSNPDVIVLTYGSYVENAVEQVLRREAWQSVPAIQNGRVYDLESDLVDRSGPRLVEGIEELAHAVYPESVAQ